MVSQLINSDEKTIEATRLNVGRVVGTALTEVLAKGSAASLSALSLGCAVTLIRSLVDSVAGGGEARLAFVEAQAALLGRGVATEDSALMIATLRQAGVLRIEAGDLKIDALDRVLESSLKALSNRQAGWAKRGRSEKLPAAAVPSSDPSPAPAPAPVIAPSEPRRPQPSDVEAVAAKAIAKPNARKPAVIRHEDGVEVRRFCATDDIQTDPSVDPVVVRMPCDGGRVAELTRTYVEHLQAIYRHLDVEDQLSRARLWAESNKANRKTFTGLRRFVSSWMGRAAERASLQKDMVSATNQRNGFGQGGAHVAAGSSEVMVASELNVDRPDDDFSDILGVATLEAAAGSSATVVAAAPGPSTTSRPPVSASAAARAALASRVAARQASHR